MTYYLGKFPPLGQSSHRAPHIPGGNLITQYRAGSRVEECVTAYLDYHKNYARRRRGKPIETPGAEDGVAGCQTR